MAPIGLACCAKPAPSKDSPVEAPDLKTGNGVANGVDLGDVNVTMSKIVYTMTDEAPMLAT